MTRFRLSFLALFLLAAPAAPAADFSAPVMPSKPTSVTVYPSSAQVRVTEKLHPVTLASGESALRIGLPQGAIPATFSLKVEGNSVASLAWEVKELEEDTGNAARKSALDELESLRVAYDGLKGDKSAAEARIAYWTKPRTTQFSSADELLKVDAAMQKTIADLSAGLPGMERQLKKLEERISKAQQRLAGLGSEKRSLRQATVALAAPAKSALTVSYSYQIGGCGWSPAYRFEALPAKKLLRFSQEAVIRQDSGFDWPDVELNVATVTPDTRLSPQALYPWQMQAGDKEAPVSAAKLRMSAPMADMNQMAMEAPAKAEPSSPRPAPAREEMSTFAIWKLGGRVLPTGESVRIPLVADTEWKADYSYTLRPSRERYGFLTARPELDAQLALRRGEAAFLVDGAIISMNPNFSHRGGDMAVFFGSDPLVRAEMRLTERVGGEKGIISKDRTERWAWEIKVTNGRNVPVAVRVEDPVPVPGNEAISLKVSSVPQPEKDRTDYVWKADVKAQGEFVITHSVEVKVPKDMRFQPGR